MYYSLFIKRIPFITVSKDTENARAGGWYEMFAAGFHFCTCIFCNFQNRPQEMYL